MSDYTGIIFDSENEGDLDEISEYLTEEVGFGMCYEEKEIPFTSLLKPGKESLEILGKKISKHCEERKIGLTNLFLFHTDSIYHDTEYRFDD